MFHEAPFPLCMGNSDGLCGFLFFSFLLVYFLGIAQVVILHCISDDADFLSAGGYISTGFCAFSFRLYRLQLSLGDFFACFLVCDYEFSFG